MEENVVTREEFPLSKAQEVLKNETVAVIGYGVQGPGQALNQRDNGINVIVGQRKNSKTWDKAVNDGFVPGETLFEIEEALQRGTIICYLLSDAAQIQLWPTVKKHLTAGKALYFSHGFGITFNEQTGNYSSCRCGCIFSGSQRFRHIFAQNVFTRPWFKSALMLFSRMQPAKQKTE